MESKIIAAPKSSIHLTGLNSDMAVWVLHIYVLYLLWQQQDNAQRIHQINFSDLSGCSDPTYSGKAQGDTIFHRTLVKHSLSLCADNSPVFEICHLTSQQNYKPVWCIKSAQWGTMTLTPTKQDVLVFFFCTFVHTSSSCVKGGSGTMKNVWLLCRHMPTLYNFARPVAVRHR